MIQPIRLHHILRFGSDDGNSTAESNNLAPTKKIKVLVVEDDIPLEDYFNTLPDIESMRVVSAKDGLDAYQTLHPDVILLDERLEGSERGSSLFQKLLDLGAKASQFICISGWPPEGVYEPKGVPIYEDKCELISEMGKARQAKRDSQPDLPTPIWDKWISTIRRLASMKN